MIDDYIQDISKQFTDHPKPNSGRFLKELQRNFKAVRQEYQPEAEVKAAFVIPKRRKKTHSEAIKRAPEVEKAKIVMAKVVG